MQTSKTVTGAMYGHCRKIVLGVFCALALSACAHPLPPMRSDRVVVISGKSTIGISAQDATQKMFIKAARLTLDHGCRYFTIVDSLNAYPNRTGAPPIRPGANLAIRVYRQGEIDPRTPGVWDAQSIAAGNL